MLFFLDTAKKVSKYGIISGPYFPAFGLNTAKYGPEITPYLDTFQAVRCNTSPENKKLFVSFVCFFFVVCQILMVCKANA